MPSYFQIIIKYSSSVCKYHIFSQILQMFPDFFMKSLTPWGFERIYCEFGLFIKKLGTLKSSAPNFGKNFIYSGNRNALVKLPPNQALHWLLSRIPKCLHLLHNRHIRRIAYHDVHKTHEYFSLSGEVAYPLLLYSS